MDFLNDAKDIVWAFVTDIKINYIFDVLIIAFVFYQLLKLIKETRAEQIVKGFIIILIISKLSEWMRLYSVNYILQSTFTIGLIALVIIFQPELRKALERVGNTKLFSGSRKTLFQDEKEIDSIIEAATTLSRKKVGALMVIERQIGINDIIETGNTIDAKISADLIMNIFYPKSPLHDGAVVIKNNRIMAASCMLPLTTNKFVSKDLGTRHRAALGMNESSDAFVIVVSEETGAISVASDGKFKRFLDAQSLKELMLESLLDDVNNGGENVK